MTAGDVARDRVRPRIVGVLVAGQILGGVSAGATISLGALLASDVTGSEALSGLASTFLTLGAAIAAVPLARLAVRTGRRTALASGVLLSALGAASTIGAVASSSAVWLFASFLLVGVGSAVGLQARFAATDLSDSTTRARDLSVVVWATTIGAVLGPNLVGPGAVLGAALGLPDRTGPFLFSIVSGLLAATVYLVGLRPDPLLESRRRAREGGSGRGPVGPGVAPSASFRRFAILAVSLSHAVMVAVMAMTPLQLHHHGDADAVVGFTISLHIAGMYALSPVFGWLADRFGRIRLVFLGQLLLAVALVVAAVGAHDSVLVGTGLVILGVGWSASTIAGSALVTESTPVADRPRVQGRTDLTMNLGGAAAGALAGVVLAQIGYGGLALASLAIVAVVVAAGFLVVSRSRREGLVDASEPTPDEPTPDEASRRG
ncbi:MFS transporter [Labedella endophytica]|uniref:MFS transporter n=1 Tax=Labedella endophytica TaxID=1523160 RepID=A0A3S0V8G6_9MICO|nr:MFS transporter [Labedella endophytica]RUQ97622.1 MFS transporter [Labedella endophytica]